MTNKQFDALSKKYLIGHYPGRIAKKGMLIDWPIKDMIRGYCFDRSGEKCAFYINCFVQPLCVQSDGVHFLFGGRIGPKAQESWRIDESNKETDVMALAIKRMQEVGDPFLEKIKSVEDFAREMPGLFKGHPEDINMLESVACCWAWVGKMEEAISSISTIESKIVNKNITIDWCLGLLDRMKLLRQKIEKGPKEAKQLLEEWKAFTLSHIKL